MAIQFQCSGCGKPIEVDDEAANQQASCPYCDKINRVPGFGMPDAVTARPIPSPAASTQATMPPPVITSSATDGTAPRARRKATFGIASLVLLCVGVAAIVITNIAMQEFMPNSSESANQQPTIKEAMELSTKIMETKPWLPILSMLSMVLVVAAMGFAIGSFVRRESPRWPAILVTSIGAFGVLWFVLGLAVLIAG